MASDLAAVRLPLPVRGDRPAAATGSLAVALVALVALFESVWEAVGAGAAGRGR
ncbi:hypothetical protein ACWDE9_32505 [Streptomyces olivaceoviridis]|uniref:hypothetical protein n=1 Tax=Streptomyces olivaceoviridis TaxID=1921 RepID=UPI001673EF42|nr:hypothetical protein [Streptomyces olivaceoviridis]GGZ03165.1 hypothetical protein GCM10010300_53960 [Streptomyces olivaceoviridis]